MSAKKHRIITVLLLVTIPAQVVFAESIENQVRKGNKKYAEGNFNEAINEYDQALVDKPDAMRPKFNKANSYYRLDDIAKAMDLYEEVATGARDMGLVTKAKYNTGNCYFQRGSKQRDSDLQKALDDMKTSITFWRQVLDIEPDNKKAARNIEVARLIIKDILDQLNKQKQQQDPNQPQEQQQQEQNEQEQDQMNQQQDPNQPQEQNREQDPNKPDDKQQDAQQQKQEKEQKAPVPDATAQEILDKEQNQKKQRQILQRGRHERVPKDW
ncbi:MAG: tetratricopeptide repeat protein [Planctomycetes bacterium]|nr:tetratricopeptide repeat protein [Planctomycetota bacterium]